MAEVKGQSTIKNMCDPPHAVTSRQRVHGLCKYQSICHVLTHQWSYFYFKQVE